MQKRSPHCHLVVNVFIGLENPPASTILLFVVAENYFFFLFLIGGKKKKKKEKNKTIFSSVVPLDKINTK